MYASALCWRNQFKCLRIISQCLDAPSPFVLSSSVAITSAKKIAQLMNEFFIGKVQQIRKGMKNSRFSLTKVEEVMHNKTCKLKLKYVSESKVKNVLNKLGQSFAKLRSSRG